MGREMPPKIVPSLGGSEYHLTHGSLGRPESKPQRHLDWINGSSVLAQLMVSCVQQTDTQTDRQTLPDHARTSVAIGHPYAP